jgi:4-amino-4-deoxy-L-arabinose transferase-like glycosyltransferase
VNELGNAALMAVVLAIAWGRPNLARRWLAPIESAWRRLRHPVLILVLTGLVLTTGLNLLRGLPEPWGHDSFSNLLAADTFTEGRLTNPPHPHWQHFETFHTIHQPTYASKYPPLQGFVLALGQVLTGHPLVGSWLATLFAGIAVYWMLRGWMPARWAWVGGMLVLLHPVTLLWSTWYFGGTLALGAGALVVGAWRRLPRQPTAAWWLGIGLALLANNRPFEGFVLAVATAAVWLWRCCWRELWRTALVLAVAGIWMAYYNWRVTGIPWQMPYLAYEKQYGIAPLLVWQHPKPAPEYRHAVMREFHEGWDLRIYAEQQTLTGWLDVCRRKIKTYFFGALPVSGAVVPVCFAVGLVISAWLNRRRSGMMAALLALALFGTGLMFSSWYNIHYAAPGIPLLILLIVQGLRALRACQKRGRLLVLVILTGAISLSVSGIAFLLRSQPNRFQRQRTALTRQLLATGPPHLVFVRYAPGHDPDNEWVFNAADIDRAPIVWARELPDNQPLLDYFRDRQVWLWEPDPEPPRLTPYPATTNRPE